MISPMDAARATRTLAFVGGCGIGFFFIRLRRQKFVELNLERRAGRAVLDAMDAKCSEIEKVLKEMDHYIQNKKKNFDFDKDSEDRKLVDAWLDRVTK